MLRMHKLQPSLSNDLFDSGNPQSTVDKVLDYVIADAREALGLLETDPLFLADSLEAYTYRERSFLSV